MLDTLIKNALIVDGSGDRPYLGDFAIKGHTIAEIGNLKDIDAKITIEARGRIVAPGFIDMHSHSDVLFANGSAILHKLYQGVTTELVGQDGFSLAPVTESSKEHLAEFLDPVAGKITGGLKPWNINDFFETVTHQKAQSNMATLIGNANLRLAIIGHKKVIASKDDLSKMCNLLDESLAQGSAGMSLGLIYPPSSYSNTEELIALGGVIQKHDGIMVAHMRNEQAHIIDALEEMITIGEKSGCRIHISHLKCLGKHSWGTMPRILELFDNASDRGIDVSFDQYPYDASNTSLSLLLPSWAMEGGYRGFKQSLKDSEKQSKMLASIKDTIEARGGTQSIIIATVKNDQYQDLAGKSIQSLSKNWNLPAEKAVLKLLDDEELQVLAIYHAISNSDIECAMTHHLQTVGSDGVLGEFPHPRTFGTFARIIHHYSGEKNLFPLEVAIQKMTSKPAAILRLKDRGQIRKGYYADLVIFEKGKFVDRASFDTPKQFATGLDWVFINGMPVINDGKPTGNLPGVVLKRSS